jgi:RimJ/RimL family protein N-acetyltransferase
MPHPYWPLYGVVVRTPRLELHLPTEDELVALATLAGEGVHDPAEMPLTGWTDQPSPQLERGVLHWHWGKRAQWTRTNWSFDPVIVVDGEVVGTQAMSAVEFGKLRVVETGSWLGMRYQGKGIGKEMRAAILHLAFEGLGAERALSGFWHDNHASRRVSESLGYEPNGDRWLLRRDERTLEQLVKLERVTWEQHRRDDIAVEGLTDEVLELFGVAPTTPA